MMNRIFNTSSGTGNLNLRMVPVFLTVAGLVILAGCSHVAKNPQDINGIPEIFPEYYDLTIPPNIAPLNFIIKERGSRFRVEISAGETKKIVLKQRSPAIRIPMRSWHELLSENQGDSLTIEILSFRDGQWNRYAGINHCISTDPIDPYLTYRLVYAAYLTWQRMGIYQRNLASFDETPVIENRSTGNGCINCHSFAMNDPAKMMIHFRILHPGTLIWDDGNLSKINTKTPGTMSGGIYPAWHPDGRHIAFSTGRISPHLTTRLNKVVDVADRASDLIVYDIDNNSVTTSDKISTGMRENMPVWSPDGNYLYFIRAPEAIKGDEESLLHSRYSLMRIAYNPGKNSWGDVEIVLDSDSTGMSISMPSISPDGKQMVCTMSDYGYFTIFHKESDLYSVDMETHEYRRLDLNSSYAESHPSWSSNGRWLVFSSKRIDGVFSRTHIAYVDENGSFHTPFVLPQKNPEMYDRILANYNLPRLITGKIELKPIEIRDFVLEKPREATFSN